MAFAVTTCSTNGKAASNAVSETPHETGKPRALSCSGVASPRLVAFRPDLAEQLQRLSIQSDRQCQQERRLLADAEATLRPYMSSPRLLGGSANAGGATNDDDQPFFFLAPTGCISRRDHTHMLMALVGEAARYRARVMRDPMSRAEGEALLCGILVSMDEWNSPHGDPYGELLVALQQRLLFSPPL